MVLVSVGQDELRLASDVWPPFSNVEGESAFAIMLVEEALMRSGIEMRSEILDFDKVLIGLQDGSIDGSPTLWYTKERAEYLTYSDPYMENRLILVGKKGADVSATSLSELNGKRIAVVGTYAYGAEVDSATAPVFVSGKDQQENLERLLKEEVDYILVDDLLIQYVLTNQGEEANKYLEIGSNAMVTRSLHFALRKDLEGADAILEVFNDAIGNMMADGTYNTILDLNWILHDVDGDGKMELVYGGGGAPSSGGYAVFQNPNDQAHDGYWVNGKKYYKWEDVPEEERLQSEYNEAVNQEGFTYKFKF